MHNHTDYATMCWQNANVQSQCISTGCLTSLIFLPSIKLAELFPPTTAIQIVGSSCHGTPQSVQHGCYFEAAPPSGIPEIPPGSTYNLVILSGWLVSSPFPRESCESHTDMLRVCKEILFCKYSAHLQCEFEFEHFTFSLSASHH